MHRLKPRACVRHQLASPREQQAGADLVPLCNPLRYRAQVQTPPRQSEACPPASTAAAVHGGPEPRSAREDRSQEAAYEPHTTPRPSSLLAIPFAQPSLVVAPAPGKVQFSSRIRGCGHGHGTCTHGAHRRPARRNRTAYWDRRSVRISGPRRRQEARHWSNDTGMNPFALVDPKGLDANEKSGCRRRRTIGEAPMQRRDINAADAPAPAG